MPGPITSAWIARSKPEPLAGRPQLLLQLQPLRDPDQDVRLVGLVHPEVPAADAELALAEEGGERRAVELLGDVERLARGAAPAPAPAPARGSRRSSAGSRGTPPFTLPPMPTGSGGSHLRTPSSSVTSAPSSVGAPGGRIDSGKQMPCDTWPRSLTVLIRNPAGSVTAPVGVRLGGLEAAGAEELELRPLGQQRVDLAVDDLVAGPVLALLDDDPPAEDADPLDGVGVRDRLDGVDGLDAGEFAHGDPRCRDSQIDTGSGVVVRVRGGAGRHAASGACGKFRSFQCRHFRKVRVCSSASRDEKKNRGKLSVWSRSDRAVGKRQATTPGSVRSLKGSDPVDPPRPVEGPGHRALALTCGQGVPH